LKTQQIYQARAVMAWWLRGEVNLTIADIGAILREPSPEKIRYLCGRGKRLSKQNQRRRK
jgi:hypothetical protein